MYFNFDIVRFRADKRCKYKILVGTPSLAVGPDYIYINIYTHVCGYVFAHVLVTR